MAVIERLDSLGVPTQDRERSRAFYRGVLIHTFGNESAAREVKEKWREKGGLVMPTLGVARG